MIEKIKNVTNPLTIIAIFAGLAEISSTIALGLMNNENQKIFLWFIMLFPSILVLLFFTTLYLKSHLFYAPKDFRSDESYLKIHNNLQYLEDFSSIPVSKNSLQQLNNNSDKLLEVAKHLPIIIKKYITEVVDKELSFAEHTKVLSSILIKSDKNKEYGPIEELSDTMRTNGYLSCFIDNYYDYLFLFKKAPDEKMVLTIPSEVLKSIKNNI